MGQAALTESNAWPFWPWLALLASSSEQPNLITEQCHGRKGLEMWEQEPQHRGQQNSSLVANAMSIELSQLVTSCDCFRDSQNPNLEQWLLFQKQYVSF